MIQIPYLLFIYLVLATNLQFSQDHTSFEDDCARLAASKESDSERLKKLFHLTWNYAMRENPEWATGVGYPGLNDRWTDYSLQAIERRKREQEAPLKVLQSIDRAKFSSADQLYYDLFKRDTEQGLEGRRFKDEYLPINQMGGPQQGFVQYKRSSPSTTG